MSSAGTLFLIHGFLGQAKDWSSLSWDSWNTHTPDFFSNSAEHLVNYHLSTLADQINQQAQYTEAVPRVLIGYSWGGRVALHALIRAPHLYAGAVLLGAHPGFTDERQKAERVRSDSEWSERFLNEDWASVIRAWNQQGVFQHVSADDLQSRLDTQGVERVESEFSRRKLALALRHSSLGQQQDLRAELRKLQVPTLWMVGGEDLKFKAIYEELRGAQIPQSQFIEIPGAGHRIHLEQSERVRNEVNLFLQQFLVHEARENKSTE